ncbi:MAG: oxidoreductase [Chitinivibrionales bacterium]|nr:oxidoreductase [Chitinivibrionales bacterium]
MSINTVVVGYGMSGRQFHCYLVNLVPQLHLHGVVSRNPETRQRIEQEQHCRAYAATDEAFADPAVDLVVIATPNSTHAELAIQAMQAGKHVVTDKVMCLSLAECDRMIAVSEQTGKMLQVFQNRRFDGDYLTVRKLMDDGRFGDVRWVEMAWQGFRPWGGWRGQTAMGGGRLYDLGAHLLDQICMLFPSPIETVYCRMHHDYPQSDVESEAFVVVTFAGGRTGICDLSSMAAIGKPRFFVRGTKGAFRKYGLDPQEAAMKAGDIDAATEDSSLYGTFSDGATEETIPTLPGRWRNYYENIAAVLEKGAEPVVRLEEVRREMAVIDAARRSTETGEVVRLG